MNKLKYQKFMVMIAIFVICLVNITTIGYSDEIGVTDYMYVKHTYCCSKYPGHSSFCGTAFIDPAPGVTTTFKFSKTSSDILHVEWEWGSDCGTNYWDVNSSSRIVSNNGHAAWGPSNGAHNMEWIYTDVSLNDQVIIFNFWRYADTVFNITGEAMQGSREVWELKDAYGSVIWYDKADGFLVNGTFRYQSDWERIEFIDVGVENPENPTIPGYNFPLILGVLSLMGIIITKMKSKK
ncbi:MAG: hypothetical protein EAX89_12570 [Candidatus Lokiarchaeota archaeon]|nr:hypothetical protein [Candidatus Lokiarchaeota archaeon]